VVSKLKTALIASHEVIAIQKYTQNNSGKHLKTILDNSHQLPIWKKQFLTVFKTISDTC